MTAASNTSGFMTRLRRLLRRPETEPAAVEDSVGAEPLNRCADRSRVVICGRISSTGVGRGSGGGWLEAKVDDGTGTVTLIWMGRRSIPGVEEGRRVKVVGRLTRRGDDLVVYNPDYQLLS
ncbi:MAG: OB-fold nucleic acid binding domain-containing protein [Propionibacteriaceae bacterium]|nr:OB-fold nucleic acid binding domain-containing protein [Propionibacteriaceae bacterium]